jgi:hypothetical protein
LFDATGGEVITLFRGVRSFLNHWELEDLDPQTIHRLRSLTP